MQTNSRVRNRVLFVTEVELEVDHQSTTYAESRDISMNGIFLVTDTPFPEGTKGQLTITLARGEDQTSIRADCEVVRVIEPQKGRNKPGMGLKFTKLDTDSSIHLYNVVKYQTQP